MSFEMTWPSSGSSESKGFSGLINRIAHEVDQVLTSGEIAELRRLRPEHAASPAFWKLAAICLDENGLRQIGGRDRDEMEKRWAVVFSALAHAKGLHKAGGSLGDALAEAGFHELRFVRLLRATDDRLCVEVTTAARFLATKAVPFDMSELAELIASSDRPWAESIRRYIARGYYLRLNQE